MKKGILFWAVLLIPVVLYFYYTKRNSVLKQRQLDCLDEIKLLKHNETSYAKHILRLSSELKSNLFADNKVLVTDTNNNSYNFNEVIKDKIKFILRFKESSCDACYSNQISKIKQHIEYFDSTNVLLLVSFKSLRDLKILIHTYQINFPVYNIEPSTIKDLPLENSSDIYCFITDQSGSSSFFFNPDKTLPKLTEQYFEILKNHLN
jgi:hypothetical protein